MISGSAVGYYGAHGDEPVTEETPPGQDFLARLCVDWEQEAATAASPATRVALLRTGLVLHPAAGALEPMLLAFRFGVGGPFGRGTQYWSWIHLDDWTAIVAWLASRTAAEDDERVTAWNATAPRPVTNAAFAATDQLLLDPVNRKRLAGAGCCVITGSR